MSQPLPIACTLSAAEQGARAEEWRSLLRESARDESASERGVTLRLDPRAESELRRLVAAESRCCAFLEFDLRRDGSDLLLTVQGPDEALPIIRELFAPEPQVR